MRSTYFLQDSPFHCTLQRRMFALGIRNQSPPCPLGSYIRKLYTHFVPVRSTVRWHVGTVKATRSRCWLCRCCRRVCLVAVQRRVHCCLKDCNMREIVHIQAGQCGNQIGAKFWEVRLRTPPWSFCALLERECRTRVASIEILRPVSVIL